MYAIKGRYFSVPGFCEKTVWKFRPEQSHVQLGMVIIQEDHMFFLKNAEYELVASKVATSERVNMYPDGQHKEEAPRDRILNVYWVDALKAVFGDKILIDEIKSGVFEGHGHGRVRYEVKNLDGSLIFSRESIRHCDGPGSSCSYSHGPWFEYGEYLGNAKPDPAITLESLVRQFLAGDATYKDLKRAVGWNC